MSDKQINANSQLINYLLGGVVAIVFLFSLQAILFLAEKQTIVFVGVIILGLVTLYLLIRRFSVFATLGFIGGVLAVVLFGIIFAIELTIHPPSEE